MSMTCGEALTFIHDLRWKGKKDGLRYTRELLEYCDRPDRKLKVIHIAGTNGKGSTAAMISSVLEEAGYRTGLYTSPYIERYQERVQIDHVPISDEELAQETEYLKQFVDEMKQPLSEFEFGTVLAMNYFYKKRCEITVLETGLGGTWDSTNVMERPLLTVITAIGLDHQGQLGTTIQEIAMAKGGIIKTGVPVVCCGNDPEALKVIEALSRQKKAPLITPDFTQLVREELLNSDNRSLKNKTEPMKRGQYFSYKKYEHLHLRLNGFYQCENAALAIEALETLHRMGIEITPQQIRNGLSKAFLPVRLECLCEDPIIIADGSHNPHGIKATVESLKALYPDRRFLFLYASMKEKERIQAIRLFLPLADAVYTIAPHDCRAVCSEELAESVRAIWQETSSMDGILFPIQDVIPCLTVEEGIQRAVQKAKESGDIVCAIGSLYLAGEVRSYLSAHPFTTPMV